MGTCMLSVSKPLQEFSKLDKFLSKYGTRFELHNGKKIICSDDIFHNNTLVILEGMVYLNRDQDMLIGITEAPFIIGLAEGVINTGVQYKLTTINHCVGYSVPSLQTMKLIEMNQLWREAFCWLAWQNRILEQRDIELIGSNSYEQIRATLISMVEWDENLRSRIGVMNYIHQRTKISRSVVAEILAALRNGGYIEMNRGKLMAINRLPSKY